MRFGGYILGIGVLLGCLQMDRSVALGGGDRVTEPPVRVRQALALNSFYTKHVDCLLYTSDAATILLV